MSQPFWPRLTTSHGLIDHSTHGVGILREILQRWAADLDITRLGSLVACVGAAPAAWRLLKAAWNEAYGWIRQFFIASVTIPGRDPLNRHVTSWVLANVIEHRSIRAFTARTQVQAGDAADRAALLKKKRREVRYLPHFENTWFWYAGSLFVVTRSLDSFNVSMMNDPAYDGVGGEELSIGCLGRSVEPIKRFVQSCQEYADQQAQFFVIIYARDRYGMSWQPKSRKPIRRLDTVHFDNGIKQELLADIQKYLDPKTKKLYQSRSMPYRRGYLFYGLPGTGKSSLSTALAGEFGLDLYQVSVPTVASDQDLEQMFQEIPPQCIVLLEDIDAIWTDRESEKHDSQSSSRSNCTLSGLLNVLDGVGSQEGRIVIMTTNKPERLDAALIRPGRVDMKVMLGNISRKSAEQMFLRMFAPDISAVLPAPASQEAVSPRSLPYVDNDELHTLAHEFSSHIPEDSFTPSQLQGFFQLHLESPVEAASSVSTWVEKELSGCLFDDDMELVSEGKAG
ncbi:P-loop containing nucleoside triphosphate hydrolase protein [Xylariaceae sp. FL0016]|nr:P-loop containing nucleoside triphosphate hydrolase protein [Xylariaceae sp. FL0016]